MKILLAEDDHVSRLMMQRTLQKFGYEVVLAENGRKAAEILSQADGPRLALIDWMMPELDGPGLCRELRNGGNEGSYVYVLLLTSKQGSEDIVAGQEAGADDYITKPCPPAELRARLQTGRRILSLEEKLVAAREEMRFKATHDSLTALWNHAAILTLAQGELQRATREESPLSLLLCDIDHFKSINDQFGHLAGDAILKEVAVRLKSETRSYDGVGRYGGEEFLILLPGCDASCIQARAEEIRLTIASTAFSAVGREVPVTVSIGAVTCEPWQDQASLERVLAQADTALYQAKAGGRNRTSMAESMIGAAESMVEA